MIRIWERRYGAVKPERTDTKRRLYSDDELERLRLLRAVTEGGHNIGDVAKLSADKLRTLAASNASPVIITSRKGAAAKNDYLERAIEAVRALDSAALENVLKDANVAMGTQGLAMRVIGPLAEKIGALWREGELSAAHEHFATAVIRVFVGHTARQFIGAADGPVVVVVTPLGQLHELGALLVGLAAANLGWNVKYLGASLPSAEIAGVARQTGARAVALSIIYPEDDSRLEGELMQLRDLVGEKVAILAGGRATPAYRAWLKRINAIVSNDLREFTKDLEGLRKVA